MFPVIGITSSWNPPTEEGGTGSISMGDVYLNAVRSAGGVPVVIPVGLTAEEAREIYSRVDGLLLSGGPDIALHRFHGRPHPRVYGVNELRDSLEIDLLRFAAADGKPFLGICRGIQVINVALGGTLYTDIGDQLAGAQKHDCYPDFPVNHLAHPVRLAPDSRLAKILEGEYFEVNSLHHQGVEIVAAGLRATATSPDSLVEGVELEGHPFGMGVQWHPERIQEHEPQRRLFKAFIEAAGSRI